MNKISLERINEKSPYTLKEINGGFEFHTSKGTCYRIYFVEESPIGGCETMQFMLNRVGDSDTHYDPNVSTITFIIIDEFFTENDDVLLYICDTSDHREAGRNRLFLNWFEKAANPKRFVIRTAKAVVEDESIFAAIIVQRTNASLQQILNEFDETAKALEK